MKLDPHQVVRQSNNDLVTVIGAGVTLHEALAAADMLKSEGMPMLPSSVFVYKWGLQPIVTR